MWMSYVLSMMLSVSPLTAAHTFDTSAQVTESHARAARIISSHAKAPNPAHFITVDRIDDETAVMDSVDGTFEIPVAMLPEEARTEGAVIEWHVSSAEIDRRRQTNAARIARLEALSGFH